jgi:hypothetical protein
MNNRGPDIHVSFVGGLGNQLFQYANAMMLNPQGKIIGTCISPKSSDRFLNPEVLNYASLEAGGQRFFKNKLSVRLHNLILRNSSFENRHPNKKVVGNMLQGLVVYFLRLMLDKSPKIHFQTNLGFQPKGNNLISNQILQIGYFQHSHWASNSKVTNQLNGLHLNEPSTRFNEISRGLLGKNILVIHLRFGDYLGEKLFGVPTVGYFRKSLEFQMSASSFDKVVVFTNGESSALKLLDDLKLENVMLISENEPISASETLELMRFGSAYILSNSTFGWWGAFLSKQSSAQVICPTPWFRGMMEPKELIPDHWCRIPI